MRYILVSAAVLVVVTALIAGTVGVAIGVLIMTSRTDGGAPEETISAAVAARQDEATFAHRATPENTSQNSTYLNHPLIDGNPDAVLSITQNWNPGGGSGTYNDHPIGVWYDAGAQRWAVFNQDLSPMPDGAAFNLVVSREPAEAG